MLDAREREITVLFSDIRGFTGLTERVGAEKTFVMIRNLMNQLTLYLGRKRFYHGLRRDGIAAMWNAPASQLDHAELACWAAINMQREMAKLSQFWNFITGEVLEARIGISTGIAHVGNAGSRWRMNYSALGPCVNLASRLEGANKFFGTSILISQSTKDRLFSSLELRRIGPVLVKGVDQIEQVYELRLDSKSSSNSARCFADYEQALQWFEQRKYDRASQVIEESQIRCGDGDRLCVLKNQIDSLMPRRIKRPCDSTAH
ncbi:MAG: adenylate/guanylate cyclase domain-containing protein [Pirellulaceae bacterium]